MIWLKDSYFPVKDASGNIVKAFKIASDVTRHHFELLDKTAMFTALNNSLAVIEFKPDGTILTANENFLQAVGYRLEQVQGKHHAMFCTEAFYLDNPDFWLRSRRRCHRNLASQFTNCSRRKGRAWRGDRHLR